MPFTEMDSLPSPSQRAWHRGLMAAYGCMVAWILQALLGGTALTTTWIVALLLGGTWWIAIRFLLLDSGARRIWTGLLLASLALVLFFGASPVGYYLASVVSIFFLLIRKYRPYRLLSGSRRARVFLLGLLALILLVLDWKLPDNAEGLSRLHGTGLHLARWALTSLRIFWFLSLLQMFVRMRLHFLRLKPKLFVSGLFIALVPLILIVTFAVVSTFGLIGGGRAARGKAIFDEWAAQTAAGIDLEPIPFAVSLHLAPDAPARLPASGAPAWLDRFVACLQPAPAAPAEGGALAPGSSALTLDAGAQPIPLAPSTPEGPGSRAGRVPSGLSYNDDRDGARARANLQNLIDQATWTPRDTTAYFQLDDEIWLLRLANTGTPQPRVDGYRVDEAVLDHLSRILGCDVGIVSPGQVSISGEDSTRVAARFDSLRTRIHLRGYRERGDTLHVSHMLWNRSLSFGVGMVDLVYLAGDRLTRGDLLFHLDTRVTYITREFVRSEYRLNQAVLVVLGAIAALFVLIEALALTLGVRITGGILSAVQVLHRGTLRLASGDLDTRISVPNQDEFGDLAASFNQMTIAVQRGREAAIARERLERELETARTIQQRLLPVSVPEAPGFEITGVSVPTRQVGGDYFDFLSYNDGRLGIAIADVSGKGMPAALLMANLQASLQGQVIHPSTIAEVVGRVNMLLARSTDAQMFATFFYGVLDCAHASFTSTNAGHNPPIVLRAGGEIEFLRRGGLLLGMLTECTYEQETTAIGPGDVVVLYTDGVTEAEGPRVPASSAGDAAAAAAAHAEDTSAQADAAAGRAADDTSAQAEISAEHAGGGLAQAHGDLEQEDDGEPVEEDDAPPMFGEDRLIEVIRANADRPVVAIKEAILAAVQAFVAGTPQSDDLTLVVIKRRKEDRAGDPEGPGHHTQ